MVDNLNLPVNPYNEIHPISIHDKWQRSFVEMALLYHAKDILQVMLGDEASKLQGSLEARLHYVQEHILKYNMSLECHSFRPNLQIYLRQKSKLGPQGLYLNYEEYEQAISLMNAIKKDDPQRYEELTERFDKHKEIEVMVFGNLDPVNPYAQTPFGERPSKMSLKKFAELDRVSRRQRGDNNEFVLRSMDSELERMVNNLSLKVNGDIECQHFPEALQKHVCFKHLDGAQGSYQTYQAYADTVALVNAIFGDNVQLYSELMNKTSRSPNDKINVCYNFVPTNPYSKLSHRGGSQEKSLLEIAQVVQANKILNFIHSNFNSDNTKRIQHKP